MRQHILDLLKKPGNYFVIFFILAYFLIGFYNLSHINLAGDETAHLGAAHSYTTGHGVNVEHPALLKNLNAGVIAVLFPEYKSLDDDQWRLGVNFLVKSQHPSSQILFYSRLVYLVFNSFFILFLYYYTFKLKFLNPKFSFLLGIFYVFSPSFFSHNFLITFDVAGSWTSFMVMVSTLHLAFNFHKTTIKNIIKLALLPSCILALALNVKFSNFLWVFILGLIFSIFYILFSKKKDKVSLHKLNKIGVISVSINLIFIWINNFIAYNDRFEKPLFFEKFKIFDPFYVYAKGFIMTIGRSDHTQLNFIDDKMVLINYSTFINRVFWFKENPILIFCLLIALGIIIYLISKQRSFFKNIDRKKFLQLLQKYWLVSLIVGFPILYWLSAWNSKLTIGYRHFYPVLIFIYALVAYFISTIKFKSDKIVVGLIGIIYIVFGINGINSGLTYTNFLWSKPKWQLIRDSTIYWGESETNGFKYLKQNNLFSSTNPNLVSGKGWNTALANGAGPNTNIALQEIIGKGNILDNFWEPFVDINKDKFTDLKQQYLVVDINTIQELSDKSSYNEISKFNLDFLVNTTPIYQDNQVFFIYKLY